MGNNTKVSAAPTRVTFHLGQIYRLTMPQGKIKVKSQLPSNIKGKKIKKLDKAKPKKVVQHNPIGPKKIKMMEEAKMRKSISKNINQTLEDRLVAQVSQDYSKCIGKKAAQEAK